MIAFLRRLRLFLRRDRAAAELEEEMRLHQELRAASLSQSGMAPADAAHTGNQRFGNTTRLQQESRDAWGFAALDAFRQDLRYAVRRLRQRPGFTLSIIAVLALGIGATTAIFSAVDAAMLRPLPFARPQELVTIPSIQMPFDPEGHGPAPDNADVITFDEVAAMSATFSSVAAYAAGGMNLSDPERPMRLHVGVVSPEFFYTLGIVPLSGRTFSLAEGRPNAPRVAILSYPLWRGQFGGRDMIGRAITLNDKVYTVVGIAPPGFSFPEASQLWIPLWNPLTGPVFEAFGNWIPYHAIARLAPGVPSGAASHTLFAQWQLKLGTYVQATGKNRAEVQEALAGLRRNGAVTPLRQALVGDRRTALLVLLGATGLLLLIAGANVMNLQLSQATARRREVAVREVLGATRARVIRQLLAESVMLSLGGALIGCALAPVTLGTMRALMPAALNGVAPAELNLRLLAFATGLALVTGIGFGLWPAIGTTRVAPAEAIKSGGGHGSTRHTGHHVRRALVIAELALTVVLLAGAGAMLRSFARLLAVDTGMQVEQVGSIELSLPPLANWRASRTAFVHDALARLEKMPGVEASGAVNNLPLDAIGAIGINLQVDGMSGQPAPARYLVASRGYFQTLGIPLLRGRTFSAADDSLAPPVAIINAAMAKAYWPGADALGKTFHFPGMRRMVTVIGVVGDVREGALDEAAQPQVYLSLETEPPQNIALVARGVIPPAALLAELAAAVHQTDASQAVFHAKMMDDIVSDSVAPRRTNTLLISAFAALALVIATMGVYAVVAHGVSQRSREFGIRTALGATGGDLVSLISCEMIWTVTTGIAAGLAAAWALTRLAESMLFGVTVHDPLTFALVPLVLLVPAVLATVLPARRATRVNPAEVMRAD